MPVTDWKDWSDVFESFTVIPGDKLSKFSARSMPERTAHTWNRSCDEGWNKSANTSMYLSRFVRVKRLDSIHYIDAVPTKQAIDVLTRNVIFVDFDTINLEVIEWQDGRSLVVAHNSKIVGGPWVAKINSTTIPQFPEE
jgi:hypothetical protein